MVDAPALTNQFRLQILVMCAGDSVGAIRAIEKNGGVLENIITGMSRSRSIGAGLTRTSSSR